MKSCAPLEAKTQNIHDQRVKINTFRVSRISRFNDIVEGHQIEFIILFQFPNCKSQILSNETQSSKQAR